MVTPGWSWEQENVSPLLNFGPQVKMLLPRPPSKAGVSLHPHLDMRKYGGNGNPLGQSSHARPFILCSLGGRNSVKREVGSVHECHTQS